MDAFPRKIFDTRPPRHFHQHVTPIHLPHIRLQVKRPRFPPVPSQRCPVRLLDLERPLAAVTERRQDPAHLPPIEDADAGTGVQEAFPPDPVVEMELVPPAGGDGPAEGPQEG
eukprot:CAMPEP_0194328690 /NCGR_PEP_ID=MMETSP0171-20130528/45715_1 /TAXON_ID=218684 /ORGANISM="Corethron pennatum, Strain L29A3" /LENGTH=112 /DNA_ID=CAMNT_0039089139 /DNA_START=57 /DNA_END=393 /DNA_ORIENTATION=+